MQATRAILVLIAVYFTVVASQDVGQPTFDVTTMSTATVPEALCKTGKAQFGACVRRERCDYGTAAIDFTLYQPRGFKTTCPVGEVCCPPEYLVQHDDTVKAPGNGDGVFEFDDDD